MKKSLLKTLTLLVGGLFLASCVNAEPASSIESKPEAPISNSLPTSGTTSLPPEVSQLIAPANEETPMPTYDIATKTFIFDVGVEKHSYIVTGRFEGRFLVNDTTLTEYKGITFKLNNAILSNNEEGGSVFLYQPHSKAITIEALKDTNNSVTAKGTAISSVNNVNLCGSGTIAIKSATEHAVKGDDVRCYGSATINIDGSGKDGLHGKNFFTDDGGDGAEKKIFNGTINLKAITKQAFDFCNDKDWSGSINLISTSVVNVVSCENVFKSDTKIVLDGKVTATGIVDKAIAKDKANPNGILVLVSGEVSFNGTVLAPNTYNY